MNTVLLNTVFYVCTLCGDPSVLNLTTKIYNLVFISCCFHLFIHFFLEHTVSSPFCTNVNCNLSNIRLSNTEKNGNNNNNAVEILSNYTYIRTYRVRSHAYMCVFVCLVKNK